MRAGKGRGGDVRAGEGRGEGEGRGREDTVLSPRCYFQTPEVVRLVKLKFRRMDLAVIHNTLFSRLRKAIKKQKTNIFIFLCLQSLNMLFYEEYFPRDKNLRVTDQHEVL